MKKNKCSLKKEGACRTKIESFSKKILLIMLMVVAILAVACKNDPDITAIYKASTNYYDGYVYYRNISDGQVEKQMAVSGAKVTIETNTQKFETYTDDEGYFKFQMELFNDRSYDLRVVTEYFPEVREKINPMQSDDSERMIYLDDQEKDLEGSTLIGKVIINEDAASDIPLSMGMYDTVTDVMGFYEFRNLESGKYYVETAHDTFVNITKSFSVEKDVVYVNTSLELSKDNMTISGRVLDRTGKEPLQDVKVEAFLKSEYYFYSVSLLTDESGNFEFTGVITGDYSFTFKKEGFYTRNMSVDIGNETDRLRLNGVKLEKGDSDLFITIVDAATGKPASNIRLNIDGEPRTFYSDMSGKISVYGLTKASHNLSFTSDFYNTFEKNIKITEEVVVEEYEMVSKFSAGKIRGKIFTEDEGNIQELFVSNDNSELMNFMLHYYSDETDRISPYTATRGSQSNEYIFDELPSGVFLFEPILVVDAEDAEENRSSGIYAQDTIEVIINTGEEIDIDLLLKKQ